MTDEKTAEQSTAETIQAFAKVADPILSAWKRGGHRAFAKLTAKGIPAETARMLMVGASVRTTFVELMDEGLKDEDIMRLLATRLVHVRQDWIAAREREGQPTSRIVLLRDHGAL